MRWTNRTNDHVMNDGETDVSVYASCPHEEANQLTDDEKSWIDQAPSEMRRLMGSEPANVRSEKAPTMLMTPLAPMMRRVDPR